MIVRIARFILSRLTKEWVDVKTCTDAEKVLFTRWIFRLPEWTRWFCRIEAVYVHHLQTSDDDRALHDHPWSFHSYLLTGGYYEFVLDPETRTPVRQWRPRGSFLWRPAEMPHRLELPHGPVWTIVFRHTRFREWGFHFPDGSWMVWDGYRAAYCVEDSGYTAHAARIRDRERKEKHGQ